jgi:hypothetical protein
MELAFELVGKTAGSEQGAWRPASAVEGWRRRRRRHR